MLKLILNMIGDETENDLPQERVKWLGSFKAETDF
jgi:hypothetical protein